MAENASPREPKKLNDAELDEITGGSGSWYIDAEERYQQQYRNSGSTLSFEDWFTENCPLGGAKEKLMAREAWLADGSPRDKIFWYYNDTTYVQYRH